MAKILKCNRCNQKYRLYAVDRYVNGVKIKHYAYRLYKENQYRNIYKKVQIVDGIDAKNVDYDNKGKVICDCPKCGNTMFVV